MAKEPYDIDRLLSYLKEYDKKPNVFALIKVLRNIRNMQDVTPACYNPGDEQKIRNWRKRR
jgi:hypothetical protein